MNNIETKIKDKKEYLGKLIEQRIELSGKIMSANRDLEELIRIQIAQNK